MKTFALILLCCGLTGIVVFGVMGGLNFSRSTEDNQSLRTEQDFRNKLAEIRMNRDNLERAIQKQQESKQQNLDYLKSENISKVADAKGKPAAEMALHNLKQWSESIKVLESQFSQFDSASSRIEAVLEQFERERINESAVLSEAQQIELMAIVKTLDEKMNVGKNNIFEDAELDELLQGQTNNAGN